MLRLCLQVMQHNLLLLTHSVGDFVPCLIAKVLHDTHSNCMHECRTSKRIIWKAILRDDECIQSSVYSAGTHVLDEAERSLHDALCVLSQTVKDSRVVYGGGWPEMQMAAVVQKQAARTPGKRSLAMEAFAHALRAIPSTICDNAGSSCAPVKLQGFIYKLA